MQLNKTAIVRLAVLCLVLTSTSATSLFSQLTGTKSIPGDYPTIAAAVTDLNAQGVGGGGVIFNVSAGHTETNTSVIQLTATGTVANPITFQKSGVGANPLITAQTGGTATPGSAVGDGIFALVGSDYVTLNGIDLMDNPLNVANPATMEYGYGLFKASVSDGCQNNTIQNCTVTLNRINNVTGGGPQVEGSKAIQIINATYAAQGTTLTITLASGANSNNRIYSNTLQNCNYGISLIGFAASSPFTAADVNNDIGGTSNVTGNTILNFGGAPAAGNPAAAIRTLAQYGLNVSYNTINNNNGSGVNHPNTLRGIFINTATSASTNINNNTITVSSGATTSLLVGIENAAGSTAAGNTINILNNTILNCSYTTATSGVFNAITNGGTATTVNINNNTVSNFVTSSTGTQVIIETGSPVTANVTGNSISGISCSATSGSIRGIKTTSPTNFLASGNTIDGISYTAATSTGSIDAVYSLSSAVNVTYANNIVRNLSIPTTGTINGLREFGSSGNKIIQNNQVYNFSTTPGGNGGAVFNGIFVSTGNATISGNQIYNLNSTGVTGGTGGTVYGIQISGGTTHLVHTNKIYNLSSASTGVTVGGLFLSSGTTLTAYNNIIGDLRATATSNTNGVMGISITGGTTINAYYNTVYLAASSTGTNFGTSAISVSSSPTVVLRNNLFINNSSISGTGRTVAYRRSSTTLTTYGATSNNNIFWAGTPSATQLIMFDGTNSYQTLANYKTAVGPTRDANSFTENTPFISTVSSNPNFLHIDPLTPTQVESGGVNIAGITNDFDGDIRQGNPGYGGSGTAPDIGADEMNGILLDLAAPAITYAALLNGCGTGDRLVTGVTITDGTGVPTAGLLRPRIYYKNGVGGAWFSQPGTLASGTAQNGSWNFNIVAADMGGLTLGDQVFYYIIAQDIAPANNLTANPAAGLVATDVNTVNTPPTTPNSYTIINNLAGGTYTVGVGGNYPTLTAAVADFNANCIGGPIVFSLIDPTYSVSETFPIIINPNSGSSAINTLTIKPAPGNTALISGSVASNALINNRCNYVIIDGSNAGTTSRDLTIENTSTSTPYGLIIGSSGTTPNVGSEVKNTWISANSLTAGAACLLGDAATGGAGYFNSIVLSNNKIAKSYFGFYAIAVEQGNNGNGLLIRGNEINSAGANATGFAGIYVQGVNGALLDSNLIGNLDATGSTDDKGIWLASGTKNSKATRNNIQNIGHSGTGGYGGHGIYITTATLNANVEVSNNMVSNVFGDGWDYTSSSFALDNPTGILASSTQSGITIAHNSVNMYGNTLNQTNALSSALRVNTGSVVTVRDNIFNNNLGRLNTTGYGAVGILVTTSNSQIAGIDFNNIYVDPTGSGNKFIGQIGSTGSATLGAWQVQAAGEANSTNLQPAFISPNDLHMDVLLGLAFDNTGTPVVGITTDFDGNARSLTTPDMGADEFASPACTGAYAGIASVNNDSICDQQTAILTSVNFDAGIGSSLQWKMATQSGGPYTNVVGGTGATTATYTTPNLAPGTYYYVLENNCIYGSLTAISNEVKVLVTAYPTSTAMASAPICEGGLLTFTGTTDIGTIYNWTGPNGFTSNQLSFSIPNAAPISSGTYTLVTTLNGCASAPVQTVGTVNPGVFGLTVTPSVNSLCIGDSVILTGTYNSLNPVILSEDFNTGAPTWTRTNLSTGGTPANSDWTILPDGFVYGTNTFNSNDNSDFIMTNSDAQGLGAITLNLLTSPAFNTVGYSSATLEFYHYYRDINDAGDSAVVQISTDGVNWSQIALYNTTQGTSNGFVNASIPLPGMYMNQASLQVRFRFKATWDWYWAIDNVTVNGAVPPDTYTWSSVPSGFISNAASPSDFPVATTQYDLFLLNGFGCSASASASVAVNSNPVVNIGPDTSYCSNIPLSVVYDAGNPGASYNWSTGANTQTITATSGNTYSVIVTDGNGCTGADTAIVTMFTAPTVNLGNDTAYCADVNFSYLYDAGNPGNTYAWSTGANTQTITATAPGTYSVTVTTNDGCLDADTVVVTENTLPVFSLGADVDYCQLQGYSNTLDAGNPGASYTWSTGANTQTIPVNTQGTYSVLVTDGNGCTYSDTLVITENPNPVVTLGPDTATCLSNLILDAGNPGATYLWSNGFIGQTNTIFQSGVYSVVVTNGFNCSNSDTIVVSLNTAPQVNINVNFTQSNAATLDAGPGFTGYIWSTGANTQVITVTSNGTYYVTATDANGCSATDTVNIIFSLGNPNADGSFPSFSLFPNPTNGIFNLAVNNLQAVEFQVEVMDVQGKVLATQQHAADVQSVIVPFDMSSYAAGTYFLRVRTNNTIQQTLRVLIAR